MAHPRSVLDSLATLSAEGRILEMANVLSKTERWPPEELERHQLLRLARLLEHARRTVPFHARLPSFPEVLTLDHLRELPLLRREDVREHGDELQSRDVPSEHRVAYEANSSGSTGRHVTVRVDAATKAMRDAIGLRDNAWHRRDPTAKAAAIRAIPSGADAPHGRAERAWTFHPESGPLVLLDAHSSVKDQLDWLAREAPAYAATYASNAAALVDGAERDGVRLPSLRELGTFGEVLPDGLRQACRRVLGVPLVDGYSCVEVGFVALECPDGEHYHVQSEHVLAEVLRPDGSPCDAGESGRVVLTALHAFAMPLIRYDIGDYATVGLPCPCGRGLPVLERILGRSRNMIRLPSGDRIWPRFGSHVLGKHFPLKQFRLLQPSVEALTLELVADRPLTLDEERGLRDFVQGALRHRFELGLHYVQEIPRSPSGKFEDVICQIDDAAVPPAVTARSRD